jgi:hypothetical protein
MIKKIKLTLPFILPLIISISVFFLFNKEIVVDNSKQKIDEIETTLDLYKTYIQQKRNTLEDSFYADMKIKKDAEVTYLKNLDVSKQKVFKLCLLYKCKKDVIFKIKSDEKLNGRLMQDMNLLIKDIDDCIEKNKKDLYNLYKDKMHPLDKEFLEQLNVYLLN